LAGVQERLGQLEAKIQAQQFNRSTVRGSGLQDAIQKRALEALEKSGRKNASVQDFVMSVITGFNNVSAATKMISQGRYHVTFSSSEGDQVEVEWPVGMPVNQAGA
jgi:hypothetical protein